MKVRKLQSRTGKGVKIGDYESQIVARLGRPTKVEGAGGIRIFRYGSAESYTFQMGRLVEIQLQKRRDEDDED